MPKKDLGVKIGTPDEVLWTKVKREAELEIEQCENKLKISKEILILANAKIFLEQQKMKADKKIPSGVG